MRHTASILAALLIALAADGAQDVVSLTVNQLVDDGPPVVAYDDQSDQVVWLNSDDPTSFVSILPNRNWTSAYIDPHPDPIPAGSTLTSVIVTTQYRMGAAWNGTLQIQVLDGETPIGFANAVKQTTAFKHDWNITTFVNQEADPLSALNQLRIRLTNTTFSAEPVEWSHSKIVVTYTLPASDPPDKPVISEVGTGVSRNPAILASTFSDLDGDTHASSDWEVFADANLTERVAASLIDTVNLEAITIREPDVAFEGALEGKTLLAPSATYYVRVRYRDDTGAVSEWSDSVTFTTTANNDPKAPVITSPTGGQEDVSRTPTVKADEFFDEDGDAHASSDWEVFADEGCTERVAHSLEDADNLKEIFIDLSNVTFEGALEGEERLAPGVPYWVRVTYRDEYGATAVSGAVSFTTTNVGPDAPSIVSPATDATDVARTPIVASSAFASSGAAGHASSDWQVYAEGTLVAWATSYTPDLLEVVVKDPEMIFGGDLEGKRSLDPLKTYQVRVRHVDSNGAPSEWSDFVSFTTTENAPPETPTFANPIDGSSGVSRNPTFETSPFDDSDLDAHLHSSWELFEDGLLSSRVAYCLEDSVHLESISASILVFEGTHAGRTNLKANTEYWIVVTHTDAWGTSSEQGVSRFETGSANSPPDRPEIVSPTDGQAGVSRRPKISSSAYSDSDGDMHASTDWEFFGNAMLTQRVAHSLEDAANLVEIRLDSANFTFEGALEGESALAADTTYWIRVRHSDAIGAQSEWSDSVRFITADEPFSKSWPYYGSGCSAQGAGGGFSRAMLAILLVLACTARYGRRVRRGTVQCAHLVQPR